jgi:hypothetical protein
MADQMDSNLVLTTEHWLVPLKGSLLVNQFQEYQWELL